MEHRRSQTRRLVSGAGSVADSTAGTQLGVPLLPAFSASFVNSHTGNLKLAQKLLGHSRYETTANVYTHALSGEERVVALAVEEAIFGSFSHLFSN